MEEEAPRTNPRIRRLPPNRVDCKWWKKGYCYRGRECYFRHDESLCGVDKLPVPSNQEETEVQAGEQDASSTSITAAPGSSLQRSDSSSADTNAEPEKCGICLEPPATYGLLLHCDHVFCLSCIRDWRSSNNDGTLSPYSDTSNESNPTKTCPMCRTQCDFIVPSSIFPTPPARTTTTVAESSTQPNQDASRVTIPNNPAKEKIVNVYLAKRQKIPCRYFQKGVNRWRQAVSRSEADVPFRPICFFGNNCHYAHICPITGENFEFSPQQLRDMERIRSRRRSSPDFESDLDFTEFITWGRVDMGESDMSTSTPHIFEFIHREAVRTALVSFASSDGGDSEDEWEDCDSNDDLNDDEGDEDISDSEDDEDEEFFPALSDMMPTECFEHVFYGPPFSLI